MCNEKDIERETETEAAISRCSEPGGRSDAFILSIFDCTQLEFLSLYGTGASRTSAIFTAVPSDISSPVTASI
jgi:hypothetical protein